MKIRKHTLEKLLHISYPLFSLFLFSTQGTSCSYNLQVEALHVYIYTPGAAALKQVGKGLMA